MWIMHILCSCVEGDILEKVCISILKGCIAIRTLLKTLLTTTILCDNDKKFNSNL